MKSKVLRRFLKNKLAILGVVIIFFLLILSFFGYLIAPDNTTNANSQQISLKLKKPFFKCHFLVLNHTTFKKDKIASIFFGKELTDEIIPIEDSFYVDNDTFYFRKYHQLFWITVPIPKIKWTDSNLICRKTKPKSYQPIQVYQKTFYLGTDGLGRDVLSRLIIATRVSMIVGFVAVIISLIIGCLAGALAGYYGGIIDKFILWLINVFWAIPTVLLAMALLMGYHGDNQYQIFIVFIAVGLTMWVDTARIVRGLFLQWKERQFVEAAKSLAFSDGRILFKHIFPNTFSTITVITASNFASAILMESGLSYLGLGVQPPTPSWGSMLREYYTYLGTEVSYLAIFPGICIMLAVFSFYVFGNGWRDATDVKG